MSVIVLLAILGLGVLFAISTYNGLVRRRVEMQNAWASIDVQLKRRHDLIPNLVETVKGYAGHESKTLEAVIAARNKAVQVTGSDPATRINAENALAGAMRGLLAIAEAYPDLKANQNFLALQEEVSSTENRIGFARQHVNDSVGQYNVALQSFPGNVIAGMFGFKPATFFELDPAEVNEIKTVPKISF